MDGTAFKKQINYWGESNILGFGFDNSACKTYIHEGFTLENDYVDEVESVVCIDHDNHGYPYHVVHPVENIQTILVKDKNYKRTDYDSQSIRG